MLFHKDDRINKEKSRESSPDCSRCLFLHRFNDDTAFRKFRDIEDS